jgi:hypothetical protein
MSYVDRLRGTLRASRELSGRLASQDTINAPDHTIS